MAKTYDANADFIRYQEEIAESPIYAGMPDLRNEDGSIQWEAPSNRTGGVHKDTHNKRLQWWRDKAAEIGIDTNDNEWISKTAKRIHPTKIRPCKVCGRVMDIRYCYLSANLIRRIRSLPFIDEQISISETTSIFECIPALFDLYGNNVFTILPALFTTKTTPEIPRLKPTVEAWMQWLEEVYIPSEPSLLSPGAMSNAPDRLDGFHSFNRCCRGSADKGRSKLNLASYTTDRRAFEFWSDGNWITANKLMGAINSEPNLMQEYCLNNSDGHNHPRPCSADHIGPISLGFSHRPAFQLLCKPCNSAKNNRMYYSDVQNLILAEETGVTVTTWYADSIWQRLKRRVRSKEDALRLSRIMRDNRYNALMLLGRFLRDGEYLFLYSLLNLEYARYSYEINQIFIDSHIVTARFSQNESNLKYIQIQQARKVRVAYKALDEYYQKESRNGLEVSIGENEPLFNECRRLIASLNSRYSTQYTMLRSAVETANATESQYIAAIQRIPSIANEPEIQACKALIVRMMDNIAAVLESMWDDDRYTREQDN